MTNQKKVAVPPKVKKSSASAAAPAKVPAAPKASTKQPEKVVVENLVEDEEQVPKKKNHALTMIDNLDAIAPVVESLNSAIADLQAAKSFINLREKRIASVHDRVRKMIEKKSQTKNAQVGFMKPCRISRELAAFLGIRPDSLLTRPSVCKKISEYVKNNNRSDPANKKAIIPDAKLKTILNCKDGDEVTYFNLQRYLKHHFMKASVVGDK